MLRANLRQSGEPPIGCGSLETTLAGPPKGGQSTCLPQFEGQRGQARRTRTATARSVPIMSDNEQTEPVMDGATDATNHEKLSGLIEQVNHDHGTEGAASMADHLRDRMDETGVEPEDDGDTED